ncbi:uncharacterized protein LOC111615952 isoform X1 [Centruroides sculpturatus]|uniref:uncharacterized protein LOC111615952 isoform X1 n=1 Tax=Centruroides sculpturatus TaxID=218467 RepID=UPI000C6CED90|nr:uncharacterized protein LOC111615952 isoform X1 [Centruroides sculpturatus]
MESRDNFVSSAEIPIKELPFLQNTGDTENAITVFFKADKITSRGSLVINYEFKAEKNRSFAPAIENHINLCRLFLLKDIRITELGYEDYEYLHGAFDPEGWTFLMQHGVQYGLFPIDHYICVWFCMRHYLNDKNLSYNFILYNNVLHNINNKLTLIEDQSTLKSSLRKDLSIFQEHCLDYLRNLHEIFHLKDAQNRLQFRSLLRLIINFGAFDKRMERNVIKAIKEDFRMYFRKKFQLLEDNQFDELKTELIEKIALYLINDLEQLDIQFQKASSNFYTYTKFVYDEVDDKMNDVIGVHVKKLLKKSITKNQLRKLQKISNALTKLIEYLLKNIDDIR